MIRMLVFVHDVRAALTTESSLLQSIWVRKASSVTLSHCVIFHTQVASLFGPKILDNIAVWEMWKTEKKAFFKVLACLCRPACMCVHVCVKRKVRIAGSFNALQFFTRLSAKTSYFHWHLIYTVLARACVLFFSEDQLRVSYLCFKLNKISPHIFT